MWQKGELMMSYFNNDKEKLRKFLLPLKKGYVHASNLLKKLTDKKWKKQSSFLFECAEKYKKFHENFDVKNLTCSVNAWNKYLNFVRINNKRNGNEIFNFQSKFESTILEECVFRLFAHYSSDTIRIGGIEAYSNLYFSLNSFKDFEDKSPIQINTKTQDFAIYKRVEIIVDNKSTAVNVPVIAIECKTYLDKTMLEGSIETAEKIKSGNAHCKFYIVAEKYNVDRNVAIKHSRIDQIFVLKKDTGKKDTGIIHVDVVESLIKDINSHLEQQWTDIEENIKNKGIVIS